MYDGKYTQYPKDVLTGKIPACEYVKKACRRFFDYLKRDEFVFNEADVDRVVTFAAKFKHTKGSAAGKPFVLEPWELFIVANLFGFRHKDRGNRVFTRAYIEVARKQGKSALCAIFALYGLIADREPSPSILIGANSFNQAQLLFTSMMDMAKPLMGNNKLFKTYRESVTFEPTNGKLKCVANTPQNLDGENLSMFILDEVHEAKDDKLYSVCASSQGFRDNPLGILITTAGFNTDGFCHRYRDSVIQALEGVVKQDHVFGVIYTLDEGDDYHDKSLWVKSNPNLGVSVRPEFIEEQLTEGEANPSLLAEKLTKHFDIWTRPVTDYYVKPELLLKAQRKWKVSDMPEGTWFYGGYDLSAVGDLTCFTLLAMPEDVLYLKNFYFLPKSALEGNPNSELYKKWARQNAITITPSEATDYNYIEKMIMDTAEKVIIDSIGYDPWNATQVATDLEAAGMNMVKISQTTASLNGATKELARRLHLGKVIIDPNPIDNFCFDNAVEKVDGSGNSKVVKAKKFSKVDGVVSIITGLANMLKKTGVGQVYIDSVS